jgi:DNA-directed RNA polymerase subunit L
MLRHRIEMLPINLHPTKAEDLRVLRDARIELQAATRDTPKELTCDDFTFTGPRDNLLLKDRDFNTPMFFLTLKPGQSVHLRASLKVVDRGASHVCVSTFMNHIDDEQRATDRGLWIDKGGDPVEFDNHYYQRSYARDRDGRPYWFDLSVESIGILKASELVRMAVDVLRNKIKSVADVPIVREEPNWYRIEIEGETFTIGQLVQEMLYQTKLVEYVSMDVGHPLIPKLVLYMNTKQEPERAIADFVEKALALCENVLKTV